MELPGLSLAPLEYENVTAQFDLELDAGEADGGLSLTLIYSTDLFDAATTSALARVPGEPAPGGGRRSGRPLSGCRCWRDGRAPSAPAGVERHARAGRAGGRACIERFVAQAARTPDAVAAGARGRAADLRASWTAGRTGWPRRLRAPGWGRKCRWASSLNAPRTWSPACSPSSKAGGAYLPLDPGHPRARLAFLLEDSEVPVVALPEHLAEARRPATPGRSCSTTTAGRGERRRRRGGSARPGRPRLPDLHLRHRPAGPRRCWSSTGTWPATLRRRCRRRSASGRTTACLPSPRPRSTSSSSSCWRRFSPAAGRPGPAGPTLDLERLARDLGDGDAPPRRAGPDAPAGGAGAAAAAGGPGPAHPVGRRRGAGRPAGGPARAFRGRGCNALRAHRGGDRLHVLAGAAGRNGAVADRPAVRGRRVHVPTRRRSPCRPACPGRSGSAAPASPEATAAAGADGREVRARPVRRPARALPHRRPRPAACRTAAGVPGPGRPAGQDARLPHRARGDRGRAARHPGVREAVAAGARGPPAATSGSWPTWCARRPRRRPRIRRAGRPQWQALYDETYARGGDRGPDLQHHGVEQQLHRRADPGGGDARVGRAHGRALLALGPRRILEIGCGTGLLLFRVAPARPSATSATDFSARPSHVRAGARRRGCRRSSCRSGRPTTERLRRRASSTSSC